MANKIFKDSMMNRNASKNIPTMETEKVGEELQTFDNSEAEVLSIESEELSLGDLEEVVEEAVEENAVEVLEVELPEIPASMTIEEDSTVTPELKVQEEKVEVVKEVEVVEAPSEAVEEVETVEVLQNSSLSLPVGQLEDKVVKFVCKNVCEFLKEEYISDMYTKEFSGNLFQKYLDGINDSNLLLKELLKECVEKDVKDPYLGELTSDVINFMIEGLV